MLSALAALACIAAMVVLASPPAVAGPDLPDCGPSYPTVTCDLNSTELPPQTVVADRPTVSEPVPAAQPGWLSQTVIATAPMVGGQCPSILDVTAVLNAVTPCTSGRSAGAGFYSNQAPGKLGRFDGWEVQEERTCLDSGCGSVAITFSYNPARLAQFFSPEFPPVLVVQGLATIWKDVNRTCGCISPVYGQVVQYTAIPLPYPGTLPPQASFTVREDTPPGTRVFTATSTSPGGSALLHTWDLGDGSTGVVGSPVVHRYTEPGTYRVALTSRDQSGSTASASRDVEIAPPTLGVSIDLLDGAGPPLDPDDQLRVQVRVSASDDGVGPIEGITFDDDVLTLSPSAAFTVVDGPAPPAPAAGFSLEPGEHRDFVLTLQPGQRGAYMLSTAVSGTDGTGAEQSASATSPGVIGEPLRITITLDPENPPAQTEGAQNVEPVDITATIEFANTTPDDMDDVTLTSLRVDRTVPGQLLAVTQTGGADPGEDGLSIGPLAAGQSTSVTATFRATDDAEVEFSALAVAAFADGHTEIGIGKRTWTLRPTYLLDFRATVTSPAGAALLPAGELIRVTGSVHNLSTSASIDVGPVYPETRGNTGVMSLAWNTAGTDPRDFATAGPITLGPGETRDFTLRVLTSYSDPRIKDDVPARSGGIFASLHFTPWGVATYADGTVEDVTPAKIRTTAEDLDHRISIDDSISIPPTTVSSSLAIGTAFAIGGVEGLWSGTVNTVSQFVDLLKSPYTITNAIAEYQMQVWNSFTEGEKDAFAENTAYMVVDVLMRNLDKGKQGAQQLFEGAKAHSLQVMQEAENNWQTGDYTSTVQLYTSWSADQLTQIVAPIAFGKLLKSEAAVAALQRAQAAIAERMAPVLQNLRTLNKLTEIAPALVALESGAEISAADVARLYGISEEELGELQRLATKYSFLLTVRSRAYSSLDWLLEGARVKPEVLKIKGVNELDVMLGYPEDSLGSLLFKKPEPLIAFESGQGELGDLINQFVQSRGFQEGTVEWQNAVKRVGDRLAEWTKWEKKYKYWDNRGWVETTFNSAGNAVPSSQLPTLTAGRYEGFRLVRTGEEQYIVEMLDARTGRFVPITGDIDPIAFTHLDGTPLTVNEHAALLLDMANSVLLQAQHGESATFTQGGVDFVASQFKPNEPALQIAPGGLAPRIVRLNTGKSDWTSPLDYHLWWDGGFKYSGSYVPRGATPLPPAVISAAEAVGPAKPMPLPASIDGEPNVGRLKIRFGTAPEAVNAYIDVKGKIVNLAGDGRTSVPSPLQEDAFSDNGSGPREVIVAPVTGLTKPAKVGQTELEIPEGDPWLAQAGDGLQVGDTVIVGVGTEHAEAHQIIGFGSIIIASGLQFDHEAGELIMVIKAASDAAPLPAAPIPAASGPLAATGVGAVQAQLAAAVVLVVLGAELLWLAQRRRRAFGSD